MFRCNIYSGFKQYAQYANPVVILDYGSYKDSYTYYGLYMMGFIYKGQCSS